LHQYKETLFSLNGGNTILEETLQSIWMLETGHLLPNGNPLPGVGLPPWLKIPIRRFTLFFSD
jgi:hypothetical protein